MNKYLTLGVVSVLTTGVLLTGCGKQEPAKPIPAPVEQVVEVEKVNKEVVQLRIPVYIYGDISEFDIEGYKLTNPLLQEVSISEDGKDILVSMLEVDYNSILEGKEKAIYDLLPSKQEVEVKSVSNDEIIEETEEIIAGETEELITESVNPEDLETIEELETVVSESEEVLGGLYSFVKGYEMDKSYSLVTLYVDKSEFETLDIESLSNFESLSLAIREYQAYYLIGENAIQPIGTLIEIKDIESEESIVRYEYSLEVPAVEESQVETILEVETETEVETEVEVEEVEVEVKSNN